MLRVTTLLAAPRGGHSAAAGHDGLYHAPWDNGGLPAGASEQICFSRWLLAGDRRPAPCCRVSINGGSLRAVCGQARPVHRIWYLACERLYSSTIVKDCQSPDEDLYGMIKLCLKVEQSLNTF